MHGVADGETHKVSMLGGVSAYEQVTRADAEVCGNPGMHGAVSALVHFYFLHV